MLRPQFSVVIPEGITIRVPIVFAVRTAPELERLVDTWVRLKQDDGTVADLYDHWILGKKAGKKVTRRWSVVHDVLGWLE